MKIIDLLNKLANGEEAPKKIKYSSYIFKYTGDRRIQRLYVMENQENYLLRDFVVSLNSEIEIVEDTSEKEKKIPEKLSTWYSVLVRQSDEDNMEYVNYNFSTMYEKINEICDYLKNHK